MQVKLRGYRIELQEIESGLVEQPGIQAAVCCILKDPHGQARLVAYVETGAAAVTVTTAAAKGGVSSAVLDRAVLHAALAKRLPTYMIPDLVVQLQQLPRLSNEKLNRKALPEPDWAGDLLAASAAAGGCGGSSGSSGPKYSARQLAADPVLAAVAAAWAKALSVDVQSLGPAVDFMALGGNSLQAGLMAAAVRKALQMPRLSGLLIYSHSTLRAFVAEVKVQAKVAAAAADKAACAGSGAALGGFSSSSSNTTAAGAAMCFDSKSGALPQIQVVADGSSCGSDGSSGSSRASWSMRALPMWFATLLQLLAAAVCSGLQLIFSLAPLITVQIVMAHMSDWTALAFIPVAKILTLLGE